MLNGVFLQAAAGSGARCVFSFLGQSLLGKSGGGDLQSPWRLVASLLPSPATQGRTFSAGAWGKMRLSSALAGRHDPPPERLSSQELLSVMENVSDIKKITHIHNT